MQALTERHGIDVAEEAGDADIAGLNRGEAGRGNAGDAGDEHQGADDARTGVGLALADKADDEADNNQHKSDHKHRRISPGRAFRRFESAVVARQSYRFARIGV